MAIARAAADYLAQMRALLPPGPAWDAEQVPELEALLSGLAPVFADLDARAGHLLDEMHAGTVSELVPDWEAVMGLPDACLGAAPAYADRVFAVRARMVATGKQTAAYFVELARQQGFEDARVVEYRAPRFGRSRCGSARFGTWAVQFMWELDTGARKALGRRFGAAYWGESFGRSAGSALDCLVKRYAPAHTLPVINYE